MQNTRYGIETKQILTGIVHSKIVWPMIDRINEINGISLGHQCLYVVSLMANMQCSASPKLYSPLP